MVKSPRPVTLVTGASEGIGAALACHFADQGHELVLLALCATKLAAVADQIVARGGRRPVVLAIDLTRPDAVSSICELLADAEVEPAFVVNCAGMGRVGPAVELGISNQLAIIDINVSALTKLSLAFVESLARHQGGILNVASVAGFLPGPGMAVYHATKAYVISFSEALHRELAPRGVRVSALCPGPVETEFLSRAGIREGKIPPFFFLSADRVALEGYRGLMQGRRLVVPGLGYKMLIVVSRILPRKLLLAILGWNYRRLPRSRAAPRA
jgi:short-subunit dehydrogenase